MRLPWLLIGRHCIKQPAERMVQPLMSLNPTNPEALTPPAACPAQRQVEEAATLALQSLWLGDQVPEDELQAQSRRCLAQAGLAAGECLREQQARAVQTRLLALEAALQALRLATLNAEELQTPPRVQALADRAAQAGWWRASRLAEAAWALAHARLPQTLPRARVLLRAHGSAAEDTRAACERFWTDLALCAVFRGMGQLDEALRSGARALEIARQEPGQLLHAQAACVLTQCLLAAGDLTAAATVAREAMSALPRPGPASLQAHANYLLALVHAGLLSQAGQFLYRQPWLAEAAQQPRLPALSAAVALVRACQGRTQQALELLTQAQGPGERYAANAEALCLQANAYRCLGQHGAALERLALCESVLRQGGQRPGSWLHAAAQKLRAQLCEALEDEPAALQALKQAQPRRHVWLGELRELRQRMLCLGPLPAGGVARQAPFLAQVAHELRNPLFGVQGMLSLLETSGLSADQRQYLELAQRSSQLLLVLCNDLLDLSSIESGRFELQPEPTDLAALFSDTVQSLQPRAQASGLSLSWQLPCGFPPLLMCDGRRLQQVLLNLLINALKFTEEGGVRLEVRWQADPATQGAAAAGLLQLLVHDTGPGVSAQMQSALFAGPARLAVADAAPRAGAGLGLLICRQLLERMGGSIEHQSALTVGSCFVVSLPLRIARRALSELD